jgi:hypothetical protein
MLQRISAPLGLGLVMTLLSACGSGGGSGDAAGTAATQGSSSGGATTTGTSGGGISTSAGAIAFAEAAYYVTPAAASLTVSVERTAGDMGAASVNYATAAGTALQGVDYAQSTGTLNWASGDMSAKTFTIPILGGQNGQAFSINLSGASGAALGSPAAASVSISTLSVQVQGVHLVDQAGKVVQLRGASASGLESVAIQGWDPSNPWGGWEPVWSAMQAWDVNVVRLPLNEASWLDYTCVDGNGTSVDPDPGNNYRATVEQTVSAANSAGLYVILDLHWTAPGNYCPLGQNQMADADHSIDFWTSVATTFKDNPAVLFELFNEPALNTTSGSNDWNHWLNGGPQTSIASPLATAYGWTSAGEQQMLNAVRATGAGNVVLVGGLAYSNDLSQWTSYAPRDPLAQLAASWHVYSFDSYTSNSAGSRTADMLASVAARVPLVITEVGDADGPGTTGSFVAGIMPFADAAGYSYLGWTWNSWGQAANNLILDSAGEPTIGYGAYVKQHYICRATSAAPCP